MSASDKPDQAFDATEYLTRQHREMEHIWAQLEEAHERGADTQAEIARRLVTLLSQHDAIETQLLYPELRRVGGDDGRRMSDHSLDEHQVVREVLASVDGADPSAPDVFERFEKCIASVTGHVEEEERDIFPLLRQALDERELVALGERMDKMLPMAPTHPHPMTPRSKVGASVAGAVSGVIDKARDALRRSA